MSIEESVTARSYKNQPLALHSSEDGGTAFNWCELERPRIRACGVRVAKLAGQDRYLASSRTCEPGGHFELSVSPWRHVRCTCPGFTDRGNKGLVLDPSPTCRSRACYLGLALL